MKRSAIVCFIVVLAVAIGSPAMSWGAAQDADWQKVVAAGKKEGMVVAASSTFEGEAAVAAMKAFKDLYGISLEFIPGRMVTATEKIMVEQKSKSYVTDCIDTYGTSTVLLRNAGYLVSVAGGLPALKEKDKFTMNVIDDPEGLMINIAEMNSNTWINTDLVKAAEAPKTWNDLLDPKWKGKIWMLNPIHNSGADQVFAGMKKAGLGEDYFIKLFKNCQMGGPQGGSEAIDKLARGEVPMSGFLGTSAVKTFTEGAPIRPLDLKEGRLSNTERWVAIKNGPHPNATKLFINWCLSREAQEIVAKLSMLDPVRNDISFKPLFTFKNPKVRLTVDELVLSEKNRTNNYLAKLLGLKR